MNVGQIFGRLPLLLANYFLPPYPSLALLNGPCVQVAQLARAPDWSAHHQQAGVEPQAEHGAQNNGQEDESCARAKKVRSKLSGLV